MRQNYRRPCSFLLLVMILALPCLLPGNALAATAAGHISMLTGRATAATDDGTIRPLIEQGKVFSGEMISTGPGTYLNIVFSDGGRVLLRPNTRFEITRYEYPAAGRSQQPRRRQAEEETETVAQAEEGNAFFSLLKGGFRAITGLIGQRNHENVTLRTPVATIGIRGTDFEARLCAGDCQDIFPIPQDGLYAGVVDGGIVITNAAGQQVSLAGQYAYVAGASIAPAPVPQRPPALAQDPMPDPAECGE